MYIHVKSVASFTALCVSLCSDEVCRSWWWRTLHRELL